MAKDLTQPWHSGNVIFTFIEPKTIYASKDILKMWSPVFREMLTSSDYACCPAISIEITRWRFNDFLELMKVIHIPYSSLSDAVSSVDKALKICPIADHFKMVDVVAQCEKVLVAGPVKWTMIGLADQVTELISLRERCVNWLGSMSLKELENNAEYRALSKEFQDQILYRRAAYLEKLLGPRLI